MTRLVFLGTPEASVPTLERLAAEHEVVAVLTNPDRPKGRSGRPQPPPVKVAAEQLGVPVLQPRGHRERLSALQSIGPLDVGVVVAYGAIIDSAALSVPRLGYLNVHFSLLPRWRGAAPVARALMAGDSMTGVTIMKLDEGMDTGPILTAQVVDIAREENAGELTRRLAILGSRLLTGTLNSYVDGTLTPVPQKEDGATHAAKLAKEDRPLSSAMSAGDVVNRVRALSPQPGATLLIDGVAIKILDARQSAADQAPGAWGVSDGTPVAGFADGGVALTLLHPPGKRAMPGQAWVRGLGRVAGEIE